jgi:hypothetical protein
MSTGIPANVDKNKTYNYLLHLPCRFPHENNCPGSRKVKRDDQSVEEYRNLVLAELKSITASGK